MSVIRVQARILVVALKLGLEFWICIGQSVRQNPKGELGLVVGAGAAIVKDASIRRTVMGVLAGPHSKRLGELQSVTVSSFLK